MDSRTRLVSRWSWAILVLVLTATIAPRAVAAEPPGERFRLAGATRTADLINGPQGSVWFSGSNFGFSSGDVVGQVTPSGEVAEFRLPDREWQSAHGIAAGPDGNLWVADTALNAIDRVTPAGQVTTFPLPTRESQPNAITLGSDGKLWFTQGAADRIGRITTDGTIAEFGLPAGSGPAAIAAGPDGNLWVALRGIGAIARVNTTGQASFFSLPDPASRPGDIAAGPDGNLWFTQEAAPRIGRITPAGVIAEFPVPGEDGTRDLVSGPLGNIWFSTPYAIGSISPTGQIGEPACLSSRCDMGVESLSTGPEGGLWFGGAFGSREGGGGTGLLGLQAPGVVGTFPPPPVWAEIGPRAGRVKGRSTSVSVRCRGGTAGEACSGVLRLTKRLRKRGGGIRTVTLARAAYALTPATGQRLSLRLNRRAAKALTRQGRWVVRATVSLNGRHGASHQVLLHGTRRRQG